MHILRLGHCGGILAQGTPNAGIVRVKESQCSAVQYSAVQCSTEMHQSSTSSSSTLQVHIKSSMEKKLVWGGLDI